MASTTVMKSTTMSQNGIRSNRMNVARAMNGMEEDPAVAELIPLSKFVWIQVIQMTAQHARLAHGVSSGSRRGGGRGGGSAPRHPVHKPGNPRLAMASYSIQ